jgi:uncharacterized protein (UPF0548 family)
MTQLFQFSRPKTTDLEDLITQNNLKPTYDGLAFDAAFDPSIFKNPPKGFDFDDNKILLGNGEATWQAARKAMDVWAMFPGGWAWLHSKNAHFTEGGIVVLSAQVFGVWWVNLSRIIDIENSDKRYGFTYATLQHHVEMGHERFLIWREENGDVFFGLTAVSKPRFWAVRLTYPLSRVFQKKFVRHSLTKMKTTTDAYRI